MKVRNGWIGGNTPPLGSPIGQKSVKAVRRMNLVSAIQAHIHEISKTGGSNVTQMVKILPAPGVTQSSVPSIVNNNPSTSGQSFGRSGTCTRPTRSDASVASVSINGRVYYSS